MAKIHEEIVVIKLSKLVRDTESVEPLVTDEIQAGLEAVVQEMIGESAIVEIIKE